MIYPDPGDPSRKWFVILDNDSPRWFVTNRTGTQLYQLLATGCTAEQTADLVAQRHAVNSQSRMTELRAAAALMPHAHPDAAVTLPPRPPELRTLFLHLTSRCNLSCSHCYLGAGDFTGELSTELVLDLIEQLARAGGGGVALSGGEPLCHPDIVRIVSHACRKLSRVSLLTNGTTITPPLAAQLAHPNLEVQVSLDSADSRIHDRIRGQGSFQETVAGVRLWVEALGANKITLAATMMRENLPDLDRLIDLADQLGVAGVRFLAMRPVGRAQNGLAGAAMPDYVHFFRLVDSIQRRGEHRVRLSCGVGGLLLKLPADCADGFWCPVGQKIVVDTNGDAYPCALLMAPALRLGNVTRTPLTELMQAPAMQECCKALAHRRLKIPGCSTCLWRNLCQSGCMGQALDQNGTIWSQDEFCEYRMNFYTKAFDTLLHNREETNEP